MVDAKVNRVTATGADTLLGGDLGCLLNMAGRLKRRGSAIRVRHVAEVLAAETGTPPIGEGEEEEAHGGQQPQLRR
jgi:L-lactate dehydrogenase complex protein LldE